jgi:hypothetical protein
LKIDKQIICAWISMAYATPLFCTNREKMQSFAEVDECPEAPLSSKLRASLGHVEQSAGPRVGDFLVTRVMLARG